MAHRYWIMFRHQGPNITSVNHLSPARYESLQDAVAEADRLNLNPSRFERSFNTGYIRHNYFVVPESELPLWVGPRELERLIHLPTIPASNQHID